VPQSRQLIRQFDGDKHHEIGVTAFFFYQPLFKNELIVPVVSLSITYAKKCIFGKCFSPDEVEGIVHSIIISSTHPHVLQAMYCFQ